MTNEVAQPNQDFKYGFYCVAYLDILGQRRLLRALSQVPKKDEETTNLLRETVGRVLHLRKRLRDCFELFQKPTGLLDTLPLAARERLEKAKRTVKFRYFSDSIIMQIGIAGDEEMIGPMIGVYQCLGACCILHGEALMLKRPIRGGIDIGPGLEIPENEVYGPVLEHAHYLESQRADYPRVLVGDGLMNYFRAVENALPPTPLARVAQSLAARCKQLITIDADGLPMLDFLGEKMADAPTLENRAKLFALIKDYVAEQRELAAANRDGKHLFRYVKLTSYLAKRAALWEGQLTNDSPPR